ncbi:butyrophilin subfamily 1 member A1-like [Sciurus carolinensis]|uniref:butyrophilin subfamily 1 member A1-like n=1 Tax=Sciurus carolinensis TaxID=30640 RepID=UPI001FB2BBB5|nr:butyrophilin subfamily 1 member A1-like [Sciurus carolinensis]
MRVNISGLCFLTVHRHWARMSFFCVGIWTFLLSLLLPWPGAGQFLVIGPSSPILAMVGEEVIFSCHLSPSMDAQNMEVTWRHIKKSGLVHNYRSSLDEEQQHPENQGRAEFLRDNITSGQVALRIHNIHPSDEGEYRCFFLSSTYHNEAQFKVLVTGTGMTPHIHVEPDATRGIRLTCTSTGWYPQPEVQWKGRQGLHFTPDSETVRAEESGMFQVQASILVEESSTGNVSCFIRNPLLGEQKEARVSLAGALFPRDRSWKLGLCAFLVLLEVSLMVTCVLLMRSRKAKSLLKEQHDLLNKQREKMEEENAKLEEECGRINKALAHRRWLAEEELKKIRRFAADVTLDAATAHPYLAVTDDGKCVTYVPERQDVPDNPERFDTLVGVLGRNRFSEGDHYWEVGVAGKSMWAVGLCLESVRRKGQYTKACPETGFWILRLQNGECSAFATPRTVVTREPLSRLGVFLQYSQGLISFYNVTEFVILYTFQSNFNREPLRPYFYPGTVSAEKTNGLTILKL